MKITSKVILISGIMLISIGCSEVKYVSIENNPYTNEGYTETFYTPDYVVVSFRGTTKETNNPLKLYDYTMLSSSELAIERGYKYFVVKSLKDFSNNNKYIVYSLINALSRQAPHFVLDVKFYNEKPDGDFFESEFVFNSYKSKV